MGTLCLRMLRAARGVAVRAARHATVTGPTLNATYSSGINDKYDTGADKTEKVLPDFDIRPIERNGETRANKVARLVFQSRKRGILENDLIMSTFAREYLDTMSDDDLERYDKILDENDWDIYYWATEAQPVPEAHDNAVMQKIVEHTRNTG